MESPKLKVDSSLIKRLAAGEPLFKPKVPWPSPGDSLGEEYVVEGRYRCWEAVGPAHQIGEDLFAEIGRLLDSCSDILNDGVSKPLQLSVVMLMVGRSENQARPTITFCCGNKAPRQHAMKLLRGSGILEEHPAVQLAEATKPPYVAKSAVPVAGHMAEDSKFLSTYGNLVASSQRDVHYSLPLNSTCGIPITISGNNTDGPAIGHYASMGLICVGDQLLGHTVAHPFSDFLDNSIIGDDIGFALEYESSEEDSEDEEFIMQTSGGSISLMSFDSVDTTGNNSSSTVESSVVWPAGGPLTLEPILTRSNVPKKAQWSTGRLLRISDLSTSLDSALVELGDIEYLDHKKTQSISTESSPYHVGGIVRSPQIRASVIAKTRFGDISGTKFGGSTLMRLPSSPKMQEMWTIRLDGPVKPGICGSWVINPVDRALYGHIVLGDSGSSVAYVIPAYQVFTDIERCLNSKVTLPSREFMAEHGRVKHAPTSPLSSRYSEEPAIVCAPSPLNRAFRAPEITSGLVGQGNISAGHPDRLTTANSLSQSLPSQANHHPVAKFREWISTAYVQGLNCLGDENHREFVPTTKLGEYFRDNQYQNLTQILKALFSPAEPPIDTQSIADRYAKVLAILLMIGKGTYITHFVRYKSLNDQHLPFSPVSPPAQFPKAIEESNLFDTFCEKQWEFCAPDFLRHMQDEYFGEEEILPIVYKEKVGNEGSGTLYKIRIHKDYDKLLSGEPSTKLGRESNTFILKTYQSETTRQTDYVTEVQAFRKLRPTLNIAGFYGSYTQGNTYNILLEHAEKGTLELFFREEPQPNNGRDIIMFWQNLLGLSEALMAFHKVVEPLDSLNGNSMLIGLHLDLKPANILVVDRRGEPNSAFQFKITDFRLGSLKRKTWQSIDSSEISMRSTSTYGAPECDSIADDPASIRSGLSQADIWSLGCIFSVAARWVAEGHKGMLSYEKERKAETNQLCVLKNSNGFHNGNTMLNAVQISHEKTIQQLNVEDHITAKVTDMVADMLEVKFGRLTAAQVWYKSQRILAEAHKKEEEMRESYEKVRNRNNSAYRSLQEHLLPTPKDSSTISTGFQPPLTPPPEVLLPTKLNIYSSTDIKNRIPNLSIGDAFAWKLGRKRSLKRNSLPHHHLLHRLSERDHVFLVDDSVTMAPLWAEVTRVFATLSYIVKASDQDGIELCFTNAPQVYREKNTTQLLQSLESKKLEGFTDINFCLNRILEKYKAKLLGNETLKSSLHKKARPWKHIPPLTIYVLTNGIWESKTNVEAPIFNLIRDLIDLRLPASQIGIQFISFGDDPKGVQRLRFLDSELKKGRKEWLDIVDTEPSNGNVWKMLLGAINPTFGDDNHELDTEESPSNKTKGDLNTAFTIASQPVETFWNPYTNPIVQTQPYRTHRHKGQRVHVKDIWNQG